MKGRDAPIARTLGELLRDGPKRSGEILSVPYVVRRSEGDRTETSEAILRVPYGVYSWGARFPLLEIPPINQSIKKIHRDDFRITIGSDYSSFVNLPYDAAEKESIRGRVLASICSVAAYSAWGRVSWLFVQVGFKLAVAVAAIVTVAAAGLLLRDDPSIVGIALTLVIAAGGLFVVQRLALAVPRKPPGDILAFVVLSATAATAFRFMLQQPDSIFKAGVLSALAGAAVLALAFVIALLASQILYQRALSRRISEYPEEEIIQSILVLLNDLSSSKGAWRKATQRARVVDNLEWIARRLENEYVRRFTGRDVAMDVEFQRTARACAARFRALEQTVVFPSERTYDAVSGFLWGALKDAASNRWEALAADERPEALPSRRERMAGALRGVVMIAAPALLAVGVQRMSDIDAGIRANVLLAGILFSVAALLATINPKQFELQAKVAQSFGTLFNQGKRG